MTDTYCYYDVYGDIVCRERLSIAARVGIAVASFAVVFAILLAYFTYRRRRTARVSVFVPQTQQQGYPNQYPPPPQGAPFSGDSGQKEQQAYDPQSYNGQYDPQYNGQYNQQYNSPQYPPATYDQGNPNQPMSPSPGYGPPPGPPPQQQGNPYHV